MKWLLIACSALMFGCSTVQQRLDSWSERNNKREFQVKTAWVRNTLEHDNLGFRKINRMTPLIVGGLIIQGNAIDGLVAYEKESGREKWRVPVINGVEPSATFINDRIFVGASDGNFYSLEASTGAIQWSFATKTENLSEPLLNEGVIYFLAGNNVFYALDAATGKQIWLYSRQDTSQFSIRGGGAPGFLNGTLFVGFSDGSIVALNAKSGSVVWELQLNRNKRFRDIDATPVVSGNHLYVAGYDDKLYCISPDKGEVIWRIDGGGYSAVTVIGDRIYYPTTSGEVLALNKANGEKVWTFAVKEGIATSIRSYKGILVFGESQGRIQFVDQQNGKLIGGMEPGRGILSTPQVDEKNGRVYFISGEGNLYALEAGWIRSPYLKE